MARLSSEPDQSGRRVVTLRTSWETQDALRTWAIEQGFDLGWDYDGWPQASSWFDFHVTIVASKNAVSVPVEYRQIDALTVEPQDFVELGADRRVPALRLKSHDKLRLMREFFVSTFGVEPTFEEFVPHVSLSYRWDGEPVIETLPLPPFPIVLDALVVAHLKDQPARAPDAAVADRRSARMTDAGAISGTRHTADGYLVAECRVARTGIQEYAGFEIGAEDAQKVYRVWRPAEEVFKADSLASFAHKPVTLSHPEDSVTPETWKRDAVGNVGGEIARDGGYVRVPLILMDKAAIDAVTSGTREISMGYDCRLDMTSGTTPEGETYDAIQRDIRINHCAIVERGRAGPACRIGDRVRPHNPQEDPSMTKKTVTIDGRSFEVTADVAAIIEAQQAKIGTLSDTLAAAAAVMPKANDTIEALKAQIGEKDKALTDAVNALEDAKKAVPTQADLARMAKERADLIDTAKKIAPDVEIGDQDLAGIRAAVVAKKMGDAAVKDRSADYVAAMFDALAAVASDAEADPIRDAMKSGATSKTVSAYDAYMADLANAWNK